MRAKQAYEVRVSRSGLAPSRLAPADRFDQIEVVSLDDLEVVLFWDVPARATAHMEEALRADLERLEADEFLARWAAEGERFLR